MNRSARAAAIWLIASTALAAEPTEPTSDSTASRASLVPIDAGLRILLDEQPFAEYRWRGVSQPVIWPIIGPSGLPMTRSFPLGPRQPSEAQDHPHHKSLWFAHGDINGHDFWHTNLVAKPNGPRIVQRELSEQTTTGDRAVIRTANDWLVGESKVFSDRRTLRFGSLPPSSRLPAARYIDCSIELTASEGPITFGDTKEGTFAVRVPGPMKVDAGQGGAIWNDSWQTNGEAWGQPAKWVAYSGPLEPASRSDGTPRSGGIVMMSHPSNPKPRCRWHVRGYGLFAANPFGEQDFPGKNAGQGAVTVPAGESLTLRYAAVFYAGIAGPTDAEGWYNTLFGS